MVLGLDVGLKTVEFQFPKSMTEHQAHPFVDEALARMRQEAVIPQKSALETAPDEVVDIDHCDDVAGLTMDDKKTPMRVR